MSKFGEFKFVQLFVLRTFLTSWPCFVLLVGASQALWAAPLKDFEGSVPRNSERQAASDLVYKGKILLPDEARALVRQGFVKDLSHLSPDQTSVLWKDRKIEVPLDERIKKLGLDSQFSQLKFISEIDLPEGLAGFIGQDPLDPSKVYQVILGPQNHNFLIRKVLLERLGYYLPPMDRVAKIEVSFKGGFARDEYLKKLDREFFLNSAPWVEEKGSPDGVSATLKDLIVIKGAQDGFYNVARGTFLRSDIRGRRLLNSLLIPYWLTNAPPDMNVFPWVGIRVINDQLYFPYPDADNYNPSFEDARWISRRILKLNREDWVEVAKASRLPEPAVLLLTEKLISRRNDLIQSLKFESEFKPLSVQDQISSGPNLKAGRLRDCEFKDYGRKICDTEAASPLSATQIWALFKSKAFSNFLSNSFTELNSKLDLKADIQGAVLQRAQEIFGVENVVDSILTGRPLVDRGYFQTDYWGVNLFGGREIISGSYLGTENKIQLVDSFGLVLEAGQMFIGEGFPAQMKAKGVIKGSWIRTYSHLKPVKSLSDWSNEPYENIIVPYYKNTLPKKLDELLDWREEKSRIRSEKNIPEGSLSELSRQKKEELSLSKKELADLKKERRKLRPGRDRDKIRQIDQKIKLVQKSVKSLSDEVERISSAILESAEAMERLASEFDQIFSVGESLIVDTSFGPELDYEIGKGIGTWSEIYGGVKGSFKRISRLHIHRKSEKDVQIYFDPAWANSVNISVGLRARIPILEIGGGRDGANLKTYFFNLRTDWDSLGAQGDDGRLTPEGESLEESLMILRAVLEGASRKKISEHSKPWKISHDSTTWRHNLNFLLWKNLNQSNWDHIDVEHEDKGKAHYIRRTQGYRTGKDIESLVLNTTNHLIQTKLDSPNTAIRSSSGGDPADTLFGSSVMKQVTVESRVKDFPESFETIFGSVNYRWRGWNLKKRKLEKVLFDLEKAFNHTVFRQEEFHGLDKLQFYTIEVKLSLYERAFRHILNLEKEELLEIFARWLKDPRPILGETDQASPWPRISEIHLKKIKRAYASGDEKALISHFADLIEIAENELYFQGLIELVGGVNHLWLTGTINGFRKGQIQKDQEGKDVPPIFAQQMGELGSFVHSGPLAQLLERLSIVPGELYATWLLRPL